LSSLCIHAFDQSARSLQIDNSTSDRRSIAPTNSPGIY
jgi:hypothetical protein